VQNVARSTAGARQEHQPAGSFDDVVDDVALPWCGRTWHCQDFVTRATGQAGSRYGQTDRVSKDLWFQGGYSRQKSTEIPPAFLSWQQQD